MQKSPRSVLRSPRARPKINLEGLSKFEKAQRLFQDIETLIEQELANTPIIAANYEANIARIKKSKRKRPGLIKNVNSKKNRQVIGGMEYDPERETWLGNDEALSVFSPQPALITNRGKLDKVKVVGKMTWDPREHKWKGNEKDALKFASPRKPALITPLGGSSYLQKEVQGMVFDPISMRWVGNSDALDIFSQIDTLNDSGFTVGNEFHLSPTLTKSFMDCASKHKASLSGWFTDGPMDRRAHLYAIRNMSILRVLRDIKQRRVSYVEVDDDELDVNVPERDVSSPVDAVTSGNGNNTDAAEDYDDLPFTGSAKLKLPEVGVGADDWDKDLDLEDPTPPTSAKGDKPAPLIQNLNTKKVEAEEDWDSDFAEADSDMINSKLKLTKKPFQELLFQNHRSSVIDLHRERARAMSISGQPQKPKVVEEDDEGLELPPGPLLLKRSAPLENDSGSGLDEVSSSSSSSHYNTHLDPENQEETEDDFEEEEEDWTDVDVPTSFPTQPVLHEHVDKEDWDNDGDIQITKPGKLTLKKRPMKTSDDEDPAEDPFDGVEIPDDFVSRLKK